MKFVSRVMETIFCHPTSYGVFRKPMAININITKRIPVLQHCSRSKCFCTFFIICAPLFMHLIIDLSHPLSLSEVACFLCKHNVCFLFDLSKSEHFHFHYFFGGLFQLYFCIINVFFLSFTAWTI